MMFFHDESLGTLERRDKIIEFALGRIGEDSPEWLRIVDPHFLLETMFEPDNNEDGPAPFWPAFLEAVVDLTPVREVMFVTTKGIKVYVDKNRSLKGMTSDFENHARFEHALSRSIVFNIYNYPNLVSKGENPKYPLIYDRWLIWGRSEMTKGLHFGHFHSNIHTKDITVTELVGSMPAQALKRFRDLQQYSEWIKSPS